jgi:two-component system, OmpR family, response regulator
MKIVLLDDNDRLAQVYQSVLMNIGYETEIVGDSSKIVDILKINKPDLLLLDIVMEPLSGWDVLELIKQEPDLDNILVIILTGKVMSVDEALKYGMFIDGYVMKPLERSILLSVIEEVFEISRESSSRYHKALEAGMTEEEASQCRYIFRKRKVLSYLKDLLVKQEKILSLHPDEQLDILESIEELKNMITNQYQILNKSEMICP